MEMNLEKPREVFTQDGIIYNKLFHFFHNVIFWEIQASESTPIFNSPTLFSWQTVQNFEGFVSIFGQVVEFDLLILGKNFSIYFYNLNVKRVGQIREETLLCIVIFSK
jgi:hypothetical protein